MLCVVYLLLLYVAFCLLFSLLFVCWVCSLDLYSIECFDYNCFIITIQVVMIYCELLSQGNNDLFVISIML